MGSACVNQFCQVILRKSGICDVRHLPSGFEINFWQKYEQQVEDFEMESPNFDMVKKVFVLFASKNLPEARSKFAKMMKTFNDNNSLAELIIVMTKNILDRIPPNDSRWHENTRRTRGMYF